MAIQRVKSGWRVDFQSASLGARRVRIIRKTKREAQELEAHLRLRAHQGQVGILPRHTFGEVIARYTVEVSAHKPGHIRELELIRRLRTPYRTQGRVRWLEDFPLSDIPAQLHAYIADKKAIERRRMIGLRRFERRGGAWYEQPGPGPGGRIAERARVDDARLAGELESRPGRGKVRAGTLRQYQIMVATLLRQAWRWNYTPEDFSRRVEKEPRSPKRVVVFNEDMLRALVTAASHGFDLAILAACWIGWRKRNLLQLTWDRVVFPNHEGGVKQPGYIWETGPKVKGRGKLIMPMSDRVEGLFDELRARRCGRYVFHDGSGYPFNDVRKRWATAKRRAGIDAALRFHDLRHVWVSELNASGLPDSVLCELAGWGTKGMVRVYSDLKLEDLHRAVNAYRRDVH